MDKQTRFEHLKLHRPRKTINYVTRKEERHNTVRVSLNPFKFHDEPVTHNYAGTKIHAITKLIQDIINKTNGVQQDTQLDRIHAILKKVDEDIDALNAERKNHEEILQDLQLIPIDNLYRYQQTVYDQQQKDAEFLEEHDQANNSYAQNLHTAELERLLTDPVSSTQAYDYQVPQ